MGHILGPRCNMSIAILAGSLLATAMEIWDRECGPFGPNFPVFAILRQVGNTRSPWGKRPSQKKKAIIVAYDQGSIGLGFWYLPLRPSRSYAASGVCHIVNFCTSCWFLPGRVTFPWGNSKQPT